MKYFAVILAVVLIVAVSSADAAKKKRRRKKVVDYTVPTIPTVVPSLPKVSAGKTCITVDTVTNGKCFKPAFQIGEVFQSGKAELTRDVVTSGRTFIEAEFFGIQSCAEGTTCYGWAVTNTPCAAPFPPTVPYQHLIHSFINITAADNGFIPVSEITGNSLTGLFAPENNYAFVKGMINYIARPEAQSFILYQNVVDPLASNATIITDDETDFSLTSSGTARVVACCALEGKRVKETKAKKTKKDTKDKKEAN